MSKIGVLDFMKKKNIGKIFIIAFVKSCLCVCVCLLVGFISYSISKNYYESKGNIPVDSKLSEYITEIEPDGKAETVSKNLILAVDEDTQKIKHILIEIFNSNTGNLDYITIPNNTEFTSSYELYKKLATANGEIPQIIRLKRIHKYFQNENLYQCATLLLEDLLDMSFSYYTVIPNNVYKEMFQSEKGSGTQIWTDSYYEQMKALTTVQDFEEFWDKYYEKVQSNLLVTDKYKYTAAYQMGGAKQVAFYLASGETEDKVFHIMVEETNSLINKLLKNSAYTEESLESLKETEEIKETSVGLVIEIFNSTKIEGLASSYQTKLMEKGLNVVNIGNYTDGTLENTKIIVRKAGYGNDLLAYFPEAEIEVGELRKDIDIRIVLGSDAGPS